MRDIRQQKQDRDPRFLQFEASMVLYPPVILVFFAAGAAEVIAGLLGIQR